MSLPSGSHGGPPCPSPSPSPAASQPSSSRSATASSKAPPKPALRRIDNPTKRHITFCKRRNALLKKSYKLSVLCDAQVATIIFSSAGRVSEFSSAPGMSEIIKRFEDLQSQTSNKVLLQETEYWKHEALQLREQNDYPGDFQSDMMGENISLSELQKLESQLELRMIEIEAQKMEVLEIQTQEMISKIFKGNMLWRENNLLKQEIAEKMHKSGENSASCVTSGLSTPIELEKFY